MATNRKISQGLKGNTNASKGGRTRSQAANRAATTSKSKPPAKKTNIVKAEIPVAKVMGVQLTRVAIESLDVLSAKGAEVALDINQMMGGFGKKPSIVRKVTNAGGDAILDVNTSFQKAQAKKAIKDVKRTGARAVRETKAKASKLFSRFTGA